MSVENTDTRPFIRTTMKVQDSCQEHGCGLQMVTITAGTIGRLVTYQPGATHVLAEFSCCGRVAIPINSFEMVS